MEKIVQKEFLSFMRYTTEWESVYSGVLWVYSPFEEVYLWVDKYPAIIWSENRLIVDTPRFANLRQQKYAKIAAKLIMGGL